MMKFDIKEKYRRFRAWQEAPFRYAMQEDESHRCQNCGREFTGNYCPCCGQKATLGEVNWASVKENVLEIWGMGNRSMSYTLWQLFFRSGYFIRDYISGKRQVSFPPVKMLLIVAIICTLLSNLFSPEPVEKASQSGNSALEAFFEWGENNLGWSMLLLFSSAILPTWVLFRHAPRFPAHSLPQGFFIQVFFSTLAILFGTLSDLYGPIFWVAPILYFITYLQLFGYGLWGTLWRMVLCLVEAVCFLICISFLVLDLGPSAAKKVVPDWALRILVISIIVVCGAAILAIGYFIGRWKQKKRLKKSLKDLAM